MVRTRVGYAGGTTENPTYYNLADHTETIQMDYDPAKITYEQLLDVFWDSHNPTSPAWSRQYMSIVFYHDEQQRKTAEASKAQEAARRGKEIATVMLPISEFFLAEDYHQKHSLRSRNEFLKEYLAIYPNGEDFINSTAVTRANGYVGGNGTLNALEKEQGIMGLSPEAQRKLWDLVSAYDRSRSADRTEDTVAEEQFCNIGDGSCG